MLRRPALAPFVLTALTLLWGSALTTPAALARDIDSFDYCGGANLHGLDGGSYWTSAWSRFGTGDMVIAAGSLVDPSGKIEVSGKSVRTPSIADAA
jgi:hypothetical protein